MPLFSDAERTLLEAVSKLAYANPFLPDRIQYERDALGADFQPGEAVWSVQVEAQDTPRANVWRIVERLEPLMEELRQRLVNASEVTDKELSLYEDAAMPFLYQWQYGRFSGARGNYSFYRQFLNK